MPILKLSKDDPKREMEFEIKCRLKLSIEERLTMLWLHSITMLKLARMYAPRKAFTITKRT